MSDPNIEQLVERLKNRDKSTQDEIYRKHSGRLMKLVMSQGLDDFDAQDVVSDTFVEMMEKISQLENPAAFKSWINTIAVRKALEAKKKKSRRQDLPTGTDDSSDQEEAIEREYALTHDDTIMLPQDYAENEEVKQIIAELINALSKDLKEALVLFYYKYKSIAEIAELTGTNENNVKQRLYAARKKLKTNIEKLQKKGVVLYAVPLAKLISFFAKNFDIPMDISSVERDASNAGEYDETTLKSNGRVHNTGENIIRQHQAIAARRRLISYAVSGLCAGAVLCFSVFNFIKSSKAPDPNLPDDSQGTTASTTIENETSVSSETTAEIPSTTITSDTTTALDTVAASEEESTAVQDQPTEASDDLTDNTPDTPAAPDAEEPAVQEPQPEQPAAAQAATTPVVTTRSVVKPTLCGDVNGDNVIDIEDAVIIVNYVNEYSDMTWAEYCKQIKLGFNADQSLANADTYKASDKREITMDDARAIYGYITGDYPVLPINKLNK